MFSIWQKEVFTEPVDVLIIGAGFIGLWCAYELKCKYSHLKVTILEKDNFPSGASVRNAGFACFGSPGEMLADAEIMGADAMWQIVEQRYKGIQKLRMVLGNEAIEYDDCGGYECFDNETTFQKVADRLDWLNRGMMFITGVDTAFSIAEARLPQLKMQGFPHLIANYLEGSLHSGKALKALLQKVASLGVNVLTGAALKSWQQTANGAEVEAFSNELFSIHTSKLLIATNAYSSFISGKPIATPARGQVLVTEPIEDLGLRGTFHFDEGYYYWRNVENRILLGGARNTNFQAENTFEMATTAEIQNQLESFLYHHICPDHTPKIEYRWAGIMGFTESKQPQILQVDNSCWAVVACNGMGVALAPTIAEKVAAEMFG